ncbi:hypothetical protein PCH_Pc12g09210 [Penicillium rubens Wisconsin 54-1255]|uniref:Uncharacterized protein n=1 Tax=Penicillium rubens (strain ATCC 28089 / DSM 1075 / NRRL 1951 / Wisconsin 54-1255) TaxID=500485 RepID=B6GZ81_PENRW|nr:hypothetical protein PCH_Pc12g09210 [Penicillium rubens Wisconsin 54-1255]
MPFAWASKQAIWYPHMEDQSPLTALKEIPICRYGGTSVENRTFFSPSGLCQINLPYRLQADEMNPDVRRDKQEFTHNQMTLTPAHKEGKERGDKPLLASRLAHGHAHIGNPAKPVSFRIPKIYLDNHIADLMVHRQRQCECRTREEVVGDAVRSFIRERWS